MKQQDFIDLCNKHGKVCNRVLKRKAVRDLLIEDLNNPSEDNHDKIEGLIEKC